MSASAKSPVSETQESHRQAILRVLPFMRERLTEEIDLRQLADVAIMSPYHFLRTFRELTGVPPVKFLGALRVEVAKRLLIETDESILDICQQVGYTSLGSFSTRFAEVVGLSPGRFRQRHPPRLSGLRCAQPARPACTRGSPSRSRRS